MGRGQAARSRSAVEAPPGFPEEAGRPLEELLRSLRDVTTPKPVNHVFRQGRYYLDTGSGLVETTEPPEFWVSFNDDQPVLRVLATEPDGRGLYFTLEITEGQAKNGLRCGRVFIGTHPGYKDPLRTDIRLLLRYVGQTIAHLEGYRRLFAIAPSAADRADLEQLGFAVRDQQERAEIALATFDHSLQPGPLPQGVQLVSLEQFPDLRQLYAFTRDHWLDSPYAYAAGLDPLHEFRNMFRAPAAQAASYVALHEGQLIGICLVNTQPQDRTRGSNYYTTVLPSWRGHGLARALKLASLRGAVAAGLVSVSTGHPSGDNPMRALNLALGYLPRAEGTSYQLDLDC